MNEHCIKALVMDVDGTLTDGKIYMSAQGEAMKAFDIKDGYMLARLSDYHIIPIIITGRKSEILTQRSRELHIEEVHQGIEDKKSKLIEILSRHNCALHEAAYIGDDLNDLDCMGVCGMSACPADAAEEVMQCVDYVCRRNGGNGAVREFIEHIIKYNGRNKTICGEMFPG